ncbi:GTP-binding protein Rho1 [Boothiomyces macroporosus]|uniref:GTP-binding protein Rho1 n=1 Tax=Boothiomyces macroporosus TaxID=261099 RepID=A0AAD5UPU0_9FUNG|nr:GTP-binding protein Rho1 [Boothiomyces macroporosus]
MRRRIIFVGNEAVGKTAILTVMQGLPFPKDHLPTIEDTYTLKQFPDLKFIDTAGSNAFDRLRPYSYEGITQVVICFSLNDPDSFEQIEEKWYPEVNYYAKSKPIILLGLKKDMEHMVDPKKVEKCRETIGAQAYFECSSCDKQDVEETIDSIIGLYKEEVIKSDVMSHVSDSDDEEIVINEQEAAGTVESQTSPIPAPITMPVQVSSPTKKPHEKDNILKEQYYKEVKKEFNKERFHLPKADIQKRRPMSELGMYDFEPSSPQEPSFPPLNSKTSTTTMVGHSLNSKVSMTTMVGDPHPPLRKKASESQINPVYTQPSRSNSTSTKRKSGGVWQKLFKKKEPNLVTIQEKKDIQVNYQLKTQTVDRQPKRAPLASSATTVKPEKKSIWKRIFK